MVDEIVSQFRSERQNQGYSRQDLADAVQDLGFFMTADQWRDVEVGRKKSLDLIHFVAVSKVLGFELAELLEPHCEPHTEPENTPTMSVH